MDGQEDRWRKRGKDRGRMNKRMDRDGLDTDGRMEGRADRRMGG